MLADDMMSPEWDSKGFFDEFLENDEMREFLETSESARKAHPKIPSAISDDVNFDDFIQYDDDPSMIQMAPQVETPSPDAKQKATTAVAANLENEDALGESSLDMKRWFAEIDCHLQEPESLRQHSTIPDSVSDDEFLAQYGSFASLEGVSTSQADWTEIEDFPTLPNLDDLSLPDFQPDTQSISTKTCQLPGLTLLTQPNTVESTSIPLGDGMQSERNPPSGYQGVQKPTQLAHTDRAVEIAGFPRAAEPLPVGLTLEQICWSYPNHLNGYRLRPFIAQGWTAKMIWDRMPVAARKSGSTRSPWNKMAKRLAREKKRMEAENWGTLEAAAEISESTTAMRKDDTSLIAGLENQLTNDGEILQHRRRGKEMVPSSPSDDPHSTAAQQNLQEEMADAAQDTNSTASTSSTRQLRSTSARKQRTSYAERVRTGRQRAPRTRMFPDFPSRDVPLAEEDLADLDTILDRFPEYLTVCSVMLRFCSPEGAKRGSGYPTKKMVERLLKHRNANDDNLDLGNAERRRALYNWVAAQKGRATAGRMSCRKNSSTPQ